MDQSGAIVAKAASPTEKFSTTLSNGSQPVHDMSSSRKEDSDVEKNGGDAVPVLKRKLKSRHLQMIAIGTTTSFLTNHSIHETRGWTGIFVTEC
jgi:amino acid permease